MHSEQSSFAPANRHVTVVKRRGSKEAYVMPRTRGYISNMRSCLTESEAVSYMTRNNPLTNPEPGILPSVMKAAKAGKSNCRVTLQDPPIPGEPQSKQLKKAPK